LDHVPLGDIRLKKSLEQLRVLGDRSITISAAVSVIAAFSMWIFLVLTVEYTLPYSPHRFANLIRAADTLVNEGAVPERRSLRRSIAIGVSLGVLALAWLLWIGVFRRGRGAGLVRSLRGWLTNAATSAEQHPAWLLGIGLLATTPFLGVAAVLRQMDIFWDHYEAVGPTLVLYSLSRVVLLAYLVGACVVVGGIVLGLSRRRTEIRAMGRLEYSIMCFFTGAAVYGLGFTVLGYAGLLRFDVALVTTIPVILVTPMVFLRFFPRTAGQPLPQDIGGTRQDNGPVAFILSTYVAVLCVAVIVLRGLSPGTADGDVWEHYLHYYREVLRAGHLQPNDVWYHYFLSRGAGLFFLAGLLSDPLAPQLVSLAFVLAAGVLIGHWIQQWTSREWALLGVVVFFGFTVWDGQSGAFFKHHAVFSGYVIFLVWLIARIFGNAGSTTPTLTVIAGSIVSIHLGFYQNVAGQLVVAFMVLAVIFAAAQRNRAAATQLTVLLGAEIAGLIVAMVTSYGETGILAVVPLRVFWDIANHGRFDETFGASGALFVLFTNNDVARSLDLGLDRLKVLFRWHFFGFLLKPVILPAVLLGLVLLLGRGHQTNVRQGKALAVGMGLLAIPTIVFGLLIQGSSTIRLYVFLGPLLAMLSVGILRIAAMTVRPLRLASRVTGALLVLLAIEATSRGFAESLREVRGAILFVTGQHSVADTLARTSIWSDGATRLDFFRAVRAEIGRNAKILTLGYRPDGSYSFPGAGLVSEPSYTLGRHYAEIAFGTPEQARRRLRELGIEYVHVRIAPTSPFGELFSAVAFSSLFDPRELPRQFALVATDGENYLLRWRRPDDTADVPDVLTRTLDLRRTAAVMFPFSPAFHAAVTDVLLTERNSSEAPYESTMAGKRSPGEATAIARDVHALLAHAMVPRVTLESNARLIKNFLREIELKLDDVVELVLDDSCSCEDRPRRIVTFVQAEMRRHLEASFGRPLGRWLTQVDERIPFGVIYQSADSVRGILAGESALVDFRM
jgi:hypothetical protein